MAALKKGAKGKPIEYMQRDLNSVKCKPELKPDGVFGPITEKAVKHFQKRVKIKVDGVVGPVTTAALQYGGPLPEMTHMVLSASDKKFIKGVQDYNILMAGHFKELDKTTNSVDELLNKKVPQAEGMIKANAPYYLQVAKIIDQIIAIQKEFELMRISNPHKAAKLAKEAEKLAGKAGDITNKMLANIDTLYNHIEDTIATLGTGIRTMLTQQKALAKHKKKGSKLYSF